MVKTKAYSYAFMYKRLPPCIPPLPASYNGADAAKIIICREKTGGQPLKNSASTVEAVFLRAEKAERAAALMR